jgi:hypothetical protein
MKKHSCHGARRKYVGTHPFINAVIPSLRTVFIKQSIAPRYVTLLLLLLLMVPIDDVDDDDDRCDIDDIVL